MLEKRHMREAAPHIEQAHRCLEMLAYFAANKEKLSLKKHVPVYYNKLIESAIALQAILLSDGEYTNRISKSIAKVSWNREYSFNLTKDNKGDIFYDVDAMLSLKEMKKTVLVSGRVAHE